MGNYPELLARGSSDESLRRVGCAFRLEYFLSSQRFQLPARSGTVAAWPDATRGGRTISKTPDDGVGASLAGTPVHKSSKVVIVVGACKVGVPTLQPPNNKFGRCRIEF